jgi:hypothetical protein
VGLLAASSQDRGAVGGAGGGRPVHGRGRRDLNHICKLDIDRSTV